MNNMQYNRILEDIKNLQKETWLDFDFIDYDYNNIIEYWPELDRIVSSLYDHGVIVVSNDDSIYLQYQVSGKFNWLYITLVTDFGFDDTKIKSLEDLAEAIADQQNVFNNYIKAIKK